MNSSDIIAICSAIVALLAFAATAWQGWLAHRHNRLSVRPLLVWHIQREATNDGANITYVLRNLGLGPAVIKDRYFTKDKVPFVTPVDATDEVNAFVSHVLATKINYHLSTFGLPGRGSAISSQGEVIIGRLHFPGVRLEQLSTLEKIAGDIDFFVDYESMYQEQFSFSAVKGAAKANACLPFRIHLQRLRGG